jgi:hypothetical protein
MKTPLFDLDIPGMQAEVNSYKPGSGLAWSTLFPLKYTPKFDLKGIEGNDGIPVSADRVAFNTKSPIKTRKKVGSWSGELAKISISKVKDEKAINEYNDLKVIAASNTEDKATARYLVDMVYDDIKATSDGLDYKIEIDALRIGSAGQQTFIAAIDGDNATADVIDFNIPAANFVGVTTVWSNVAADGIKDIITQQKAIAAQGLKKPLYAIIEDATFELLLAQTATLKRVASVVVNAVGLTASEVLSVDNVNSYMRMKGFPQFLVIDSYATIETKAGVQTTIKPWNANAVVLTPTPQLGWTYYKPVPVIANSDALQVQGKYGKTTVYSDLNPMVEVTMGEAYVQPALINRASLVFINIAHATVWNGGV